MPLGLERWIPLRSARALIEECGYGRRRGELEDAEQAAREW
jgi:hypothetical protein